MVLKRRIPGGIQDNKHEYSNRTLTHSEKNRQDDSLSKALTMTYRTKRQYTVALFNFIIPLWYSMVCYDTVISMVLFNTQNYSVGLFNTVIIMVLFNITLSENEFGHMITLTE